MHRKSRLVRVSTSASAVVLAAMCLPACGHQSLRPTLVERREIKQSLPTVEGWTSYHIQAITVASDHSWASVRLQDNFGTLTYLFRKTQQGAAHWRAVYVFAKGEPADGGCAYAPRKTVEELYGVRCPTYNALHALPTTRKEQTMFLRIYKKDLPSLSGSRLTPTTVQLETTCISQLDPSWAASQSYNGNGEPGAPGTNPGPVVWFRREGEKWRSYWLIAIPRPIVLSLASCVGFNAASWKA